MQPLLFTNLFLLAHLCQSQSVCDPSKQGPISIPVKNVTLQNPVIRRGVAVSVGTPPQNFAWAIAANVNNSYVYDLEGQCSSDTPSVKCMVNNGGAFNTGGSSTWEPVNSLETPDPALNTANDRFGTDTMHLNTSISLSSFPLDIPRSHLSDMNMLGLGRQSTLLQQMKNAGIIASRSWSVFWGLTGTDSSSQMDGSLVLGGYDAAKIGGSNLTQSFTANPNCSSSMLVTVTDIQTDGGNSILGENEGTAFLMCIEPSFELITVTTPIWNNFLGIVGGTGTGGLDGNNRSYGLNVFGEDFLASNVYAGGLTFFISASTGNIEITIPNSQLVQNDISLDSSGTIVFNESVREVMLNELQSINDNDMPQLGMTFLQAAYLSVNLDEETFSLWPVNPTTEEKLVGIGEFNCSSHTTNSSSSTSSNSTSSSHGSGSTNITGGEIAGIVIGAIATMALVGLLGLCLLKQRRRSRRGSSEPFMDSDHHNARSHGAKVPFSNSQTFEKSELDSTSSAGPTYGHSVNNRNSTHKFPHEIGQPVQAPVELPVWRAGVE